MDCGSRHPAGRAAGLEASAKGKCKAVVEHHGGLRGYADDHVEVGDGPGRVRILGSGLVLRAMDRDTLIVTGRISGVEYA